MAEKYNQHELEELQLKHGRIHRLLDTYRYDTDPHQVNINSINIISHQCPIIFNY